jgi:hypothetical protein
MEYKSFKDSQFSIMLKGITNLLPDTTISIKELITLYLDDVSRAQGKELSNCIDEAKKKKLKERAIYITPYGSFTSRCNEDIVSYNKNILAIDIDKLKPEQIDTIYKTLSNNPHVLLVFVSARGRGLKALINIEYNNVTDVITEHYNLLRDNKEVIERALGLEIGILDRTSFVLSQPFIITYNDRHYYNLGCEPIRFNFLPLVVKETNSIATPQKIKEIATKTNLEAKTERERLVLRRFNMIVLYSNEARHPQIAKFKATAKEIHYAPDLKTDLYNRGWAMVVEMYGNEKTAIGERALISYKNIWENTPRETIPYLENIK